MDTKLYYRSGYKYQLTQDYVFTLPSYFPNVLRGIETDYLRLSVDNTLVIKKGYASDGPSGPTIDTKTFMRGAFIHDALYQLERLGFLEKNTYRPIADRILYDVCREDGMIYFRALYVYYGVRWFAKSAAMKGTEKNPISVP